MTSPAIAPERIKSAEACAITGLSPRVLQQMAERGEIPGSLKLGARYVFDVTRLRTWLAELEQRQAEGRDALGDQLRRPRRSGHSTAPRHHDAYEQAMSKLLATPIDPFRQPKRPRRSRAPARPPISRGAVAIGSNSTS
jgi:hypothetical protein